MAFTITAKEKKMVLKRRMVQAEKPSPHATQGMQDIFKANGFKLKMTNKFGDLWVDKNKIAITLDPPDKGIYDCERVLPTGEVKEFAIKKDSDLMKWVKSKGTQKASLKPSLQGLSVLDNGIYWLSSPKAIVMKDLDEEIHTDLIDVAQDEMSWDEFAKEYKEKAKKIAVLLSKYKSLWLVWEYEGDAVLVNEKPIRLGKGSRLEDFGSPAILPVKKPGILVLALDH